MDIVAIVLVVLKKWKPALIVSIIGGSLMLILIPFVEFWWISGIIYLITILVSINGLSHENKQFASNDNSNAVIVDKSADDIAKDLNELDSLYQRGIITEEEYYASRKRILGIR